jgi:DNA mismatch repair protein MutS2
MFFVQVYEHNTPFVVSHLNFTFRLVRIYPEDSLSRFEFDRIRVLVEAHCRNSMSKALAHELVPQLTPETVLPTLQRTAEFLNLLQSGSFFPPSSFPEINQELNLLSVQGATLLEKQFIAISEVCETSNSVVRYLADKKEVLPAIAVIFDSVRLNKEIPEAIFSILDAAGEVKTSASKELASIRKNLADARRELDRVFRAQLQKLKKLGWLADTEESVYNGRRVLSVVAEQKRNVRGLMQGNSDTGKTAFIEPIETVDLNNEVYDLLQQERREILRILKQLTSDIRPYRSELEAMQTALTELDFTRAKALFAQEIDASMPAFSGKSNIRLLEARHPLLYLQNKKHRKAVIPMSCTLDGTNRLVVISGPNAGGKSIALKTVGLLQLMWQSGLLPSVSEKSELGIFHRFFCDIGDSQSIEYELSTYSSRLAKMKYFLQFADRRTLVLIDEFGTGTDPELGGAVAEAILEELSRMKAMGIITTHYMNIKLAAERLDGVQNASMLFDDETLMPKFMFSLGQPGSSYTYIIAEKAGLPKEVIERARAKTTSDKLTLDVLLQQLHQKEDALMKLAQVFDEKQLKAEESRKKYEELYARWKLKMEKKSATADEDQKTMELGRKFGEWMKEWERSKDKKAVLEKVTRKFNAEKLKKLSKAQEAKKEKKRIQELERKKLVLKVGSRVKLLKGKNVGVVEEISGNKAKVMFGNLKTIASIETLEVIDSPDK